MCRPKGSLFTQSAENCNIGGRGAEAVLFGNGSPSSDGRHSGLRGRGGRPIALPLDPSLKLPNRIVQKHGHSSPIHGRKFPNFFTTHLSQAYEQPRTARRDLFAQR